MLSLIASCRLDRTDTDSSPKDRRAVTIPASAHPSFEGGNVPRTANQRTGGSVMTLGILHALKGPRNVEELLRAIPDALRPLLGFDCVSLLLNRNPANKPCWYVLEGECAVPPVHATQGFLSACAVPVPTAYRSLGKLEIASRRANAYSDADVRLLTVVADQVALALDNALSHEQLREEQDRLTLLLELTNSLVSNLELRDVLTAVRSARRVMRSDSAVVALPDADAGHLRAYALDCQDGRDILEEGALIDAQGTIAAYVFRTGKAWVGRVADVLESGLELNPKWLELGFTVGCVLPLASRHRILGTLGLRRREDKVYTEDEINNLSPRRAKAFVKLNCAAIPTGLLESELFGHEKGAFTGAIAQRIGRFELANGGTIFLDEIGEIPLELETKLLRVLQEREFERLGSTRTLRTDTRLIAATNRDLRQMVGDQQFRSDLYYRLNVFPIRVPALRERKEDIPLLVRHFVQEFSRRNNRVIDTVPSETMETLVCYHWPGNIRELQNVIERAVIISKGPVLHVSLAELKRDVSTKTSPEMPKPSSVRHASLQDALDETERAEILHALEEANGVVGGPNGAAARLGIKRTTLHVRMQKLGIHVSRTAINGRR